MRLHGVNGYDALAACLTASSKVRNGEWVQGAPTHVFAQFLAELEKIGYRLGIPDREAER